MTTGGTPPPVALPRSPAHAKGRGFCMFARVHLLCHPGSLHCSRVRANIEGRKVWRALPALTRSRCVSFSRRGHCSGSRGRRVLFRLTVVTAHPFPAKDCKAGTMAPVSTSTVPPVAFMRYPFPRVLFRLHGAGAPLPACPLPPVALPACAHHRAGRGHFHPFPGVAVMRGASPCSPFTAYPWRLLPAQGVRGHSLPACVVSACSRLPRGA